MGGSSGGMLGKTGSSTNSSAYAPQLANIGTQLFNMAKPVDQQITAQTGEALRTGGVNSQIPAISAATASARESQSQNTTQLRQNLAAHGLENTSFGNALLQQNGMTNASTDANIGPNMVDNFLGKGLGATQNIQNAGLGALSNAASLDTTSTSTESGWQAFTQGTQLALTGKSSGGGTTPDTNTNPSMWDNFGSGGSGKGGGSSAAFSTALMS